MLDKWLPLKNVSALSELMCSWACALAYASIHVQRIAFFAKGGLLGTTSLPSPRRDAGGSDRAEKAPGAPSSPGGRGVGESSLFCLFVMCLLFV